MVSQQLIDIIIRAEDRATAIIKKVETQLSNVRKLALDMTTSFDSASNGANKLGTNLTKINPYQLRKVNDISLLIQSALLIVARNIRTVQNELNKTNGSRFKQIEGNVKQLDTTLISTKGSANQLDRAFDTIDARAISVVDAKALSLKERLLSIIPTASEVKVALNSIGTVNFGGLSGKIDGLKAKLSGLGSSSSYATGGLNQLNTGSRVLGAGLGFLRNAASMTVGMIGYDLFNSVMESGRAAINASANLDYFADRLNLSKSQVQKFNSDLSSMQKGFKKVNMKAVGATAEEMAYKFGVSADKLNELTRMTATMSSEFVRQGRTQEDAILAVGDALDGEFRRLKEIGISQDMLMKNGWSGDIEDKTTLIDALNTVMDDNHLGYEGVAKDIKDLDDAYQALSISGGLLMEKVLVPITSVLIGMAEGAMSACDMIMGGIDGLTNAWNGLPDWAKDAVGVGLFTLALTALALFITASLVPAITGAILTTLNWAATIWGALAPLLPFIAAAVIAAVAIYEVGKAFGWWDDVGSMLDAIKTNIGRLWDAFIHHPDVQGIISAIGDAWKWLQDTLKPVVDWLKGIWDQMFPESAKGKVDGTRAIIDALGAAWTAMTMPIRMVITVLQFLWSVFQSVGSAIQTVQSKFGAFGGFLATVGAPIIFVYELLKKIVCILLGCSPGIVPALEKVQEVFTTVWNAISGFVSGVISTVIGYIQPLLDILTQIWEFMSTSFLPVWQLIVNIFTLVYATVMQIIDVFSQFLSGQITLPQMLSMVWELISNMFFTVLGTIINFVISWAGQLIGNAISAASGFVNGIITWISSLPGRVWSWLSQTTSRIITAGGQWVNTAKQKASEMVNGAVTNVQQMPGKIYTEFTKVPDRIKDAIPKAIAAAIDFGKGILKGVLDALGIHSPGDIQKGIEAEFNNTVGKIKDVIAPAGVYARQLGETIMDKFGSVKLSLDTDDLMPYNDLDMDPLENLDVNGLDLSNMDTGLASAMGMTDTTNTMIGESYNNLAAMMQNTLSSMVLADQLAYGSIQSNDINTFNTIQNSLNMNLLSMSNNLRAQLNQMLLNHKNAMGSADTTTRTHLASMLLQTEKVTGEMRFAWSVMATSIIDAAGRIKNEATTYFNQLSVTIGTFYKKLQNPSQWGSGPGSSTVHSNRRVGYDPSVGSRITRNVANAMRVENKAPSYITGSTASTLPLQKGYLEYLNINQSSRIKVNDLIQSGAIKEEYLSLLSSDAAGWEDTVSPNVNYIKSIARNWSMKGPQIPTGAGIVNTGMAFKVSDFENGAPKISFDAFEKIARAIFTTVPYPSSMYFNSDRYGSWQNAMAHGEMNCWDGANCLLALAHMCGFSGYRASGTWNGIAHVFPVINGKKMDTTSMQNRGNWEGVAAGNIQINMPKVMGKSTPNRSNLDGMFNIENIFENNTDSGKEIVKETSSEEITLKLEHNVNVNVDGKTEEVDTDALIAELTAKVTDKRLIDRIADALIKRDKRIIRMGGAI